MLDVHSLRFPHGKRRLEYGGLFAWENEIEKMPMSENSTKDGMANPEFYLIDVRIYYNYLNNTTSISTAIAFFPPDMLLTHFF